MTKQEINEYLAEHLFGYKIENITSAVKILCDGGYVCGIGKLIKLNSEAYVPVTEYHLHWQEVLEKLCFLTDCCCRNILLEYDSENRLFVAEVMQPFNEIAPIFCRGDGNTLGEAVCRVAVEYIKNQ